MEIISYRSPLPQNSIVKDSFVDRNPNMSYLVYSKDKHAAMIDAGNNIDAVLRDIKERGLQLDCLLLTHNHHDHTFALTDWIKRFPGLPIGVHSSSLCSLGASGVSQILPLTEGLDIKVGEEHIQVIEAPGHTRDSLIFWDKSGNNLMTGDVIFGGNIGCSDYRGGGNRNIFYQTIVNLLKILPAGTHLYPGHFSEHYQTPPPYELAAEKINNPYLANALAGKRGRFDRALKIFSQEFEYAEVIMLDESDIEAICSMEQEIWIPELQASREIIQERLHNGHKLLPVNENGGFAGMVGWCYSPFSVDDGPEKFPENFRQFSNCKSCCPDNARSAFIYNVGVKPTARRKGAGSMMLQESFEKIRKAGISQVFIDSRMPSYNGSGKYPQESIVLNKEFRGAVDRYLSTGRFPEDKAFLSDPAVRFYMKNSLSPWLIRRDFIDDPPSGNMRVICCLNLDQEPPLAIIPA